LFCCRCKIEEVVSQRDFPEVRCEERSRECVSLGGEDMA
jgi:hypothetical protein